MPALVLDEIDSRHVHEHLARVVDRLWNIVMRNRAAERLFSLAGPLDERWREIGAGDQPNIALLTLHPKGFKPLFANFDAIAESFVVRIKRDMARYASVETREEYRALLSLLPKYDVGPGEDPRGFCCPPSPSI